MKRFKNTYRIETTRLKTYDYASAGWYQVVVCTKERVCCFGEVIDGEMHLSEAGNIARWAWLKTLTRYERAVPDVFVVMPNHVHLIIGIQAIVETRRGASLQQRKPNQLGLLRKHSLSSIINHYKGRAIKHIRLRYPTFAWQPRFYDRVIRNDRELNATRKYVRQNPLEWHLDRNHPDNQP